MRRYDEARRSHTDRAWSLFTEGGEGGAPDTLAELPEFGWCVDEDGVRAVRPYMVAHEQRQHSRRRCPAPPISRQGSGLAPDVPADVAHANAPGEWDELAGLIRQWDAQRALVV
ncbi:hypothetical protein [Nocardiopsis sp. NRRL B-16309]|uniref:hypothetical protein n=1 Tax=Nocardiopsis sp. NRRL B-16309 TaxID=1519494 RepID=UPI0006ADFA05|nr:hypothetical protein [Nocardiopsis sp. NRRL B-16309]KOX16144.1 hypothetical protein ADL05_13180 [Nocardiopsis sp. NRRL B-16309]